LGVLKAPSYYSLAHRQTLVLLVDVPPALREQIATPQSRDERRTNHRPRQRRQRFEQWEDGAQDVVRR